MWLKHLCSNLHEPLRKQKKSSSYSWHPMPHQSTPLQPPPTPSSKSTRSLRPPYPMLSLETSTPTHGFLVPFLSLLYHLFTLLNYLLTTSFQWAGIINASCVFSIIFSWSHLSLGVNRYLALLSNQILSNCDFLLYARVINPINSTVTAMIFFQTQAGVEWESRGYIVVFPPVCVFSSPTVLPPL